MSDRPQGQARFVTAAAVGIGRGCALAFARKARPCSQPISTRKARFAEG